MKVLVIGLGSMGKRRIRLIQKYNEKIEILGVDTKKERRETCTKEYNIKTYDNLEIVLEENDINCAFICTSPLSHSEIITECLKRKIHIFTELNLVSNGYERNINLAKENDLVLFLSSTFLYRDEIIKIKSLVKNTKCLFNYSYHVGQYLPDWHPWEDYKDFFVGNKRSNGCRELFAIELPWLIDVFGDITKVDVVKNKISSLNIDYNDNYLVTIQHNTGHKGILALDVVSRKAVRNIEIFGEELFINWDGTPRGLKVYDYDKKVDISINLYEETEIDQLDNYSNVIIENAYLNEIVAFFETIENKTVPVYNFEKDREVLEIIDEIEA